MTRRAAYQAAADELRAWASTLTVEDLAAAHQLDTEATDQVYDLLHESIEILAEKLAEKARRTEEEEE